MTILTHPNSALLVKCTPVVKVTEELRLIAHEMYKTMKSNNGIGLAAPQVGLTFSLLVMDIDNSPLYLFNPKIEQKSSLKRGMDEGCLSFPNEIRRIKRPISVKIKYRDEFNKMQYKELTGLYARVFQHEYDHLQGILFTSYDEVDNEENN